MDESKSVDSCGLIRFNKGLPLNYDTLAIVLSGIYYYKFDQKAIIGNALKLKKQEVK